MYIVFNAIIERIKNIGNQPICNGKAASAPHFGEWCFILCYRCTFILIGAIVSALFVYKLRHKKLSTLRGIIISAFLLLPIIIDGSLQYGFGISSNNIRRAVTGFLCGVAVVVLVSTLPLDKRNR